MTLFDSVISFGTGLFAAKAKKQRQELQRLERERQQQQQQEQGAKRTALPPPPKPEAVGFVVGDVAKGGIAPGERHTNLAACEYMEHTSSWAVEGVRAKIRMLMEANDIGECNRVLAEHAAAIEELKRKQMAQVAQVSGTRAPAEPQQQVRRDAILREAERARRAERRALAQAPPACLEELIPEEMMERVGRLLTLPMEVLTPEALAGEWAAAFARGVFRGETLEVKEIARLLEITFASIRADPLMGAPMNVEVMGTDLFKDLLAMCAACQQHAKSSSN
jgi:hypothetical protein